MQSHTPTAPFGPRSLTLAHVATQLTAKAATEDTPVHKWNVFRAICTARERLGVSERALAILNALLTFHPETALTGPSLIVFPSNQMLALRAHGMPATTLRRHLAALVDAGLIIRRDSPNGKRYARKGRGGEIKLAFGFDLTPLVARAAEFEQLAEDVSADARALKLVRERITLCRRDIVKMIETGIEEGVPTRQPGRPGPADWTELTKLYQAIVARIPRRAAREILEPIAEELSLLADEIRGLLENHVKTSKMDANESQSGGHIQNSNTDPITESEPALQESQPRPPEPGPLPTMSRKDAFPLGMVLHACPDFGDYAKGGIANWRDFMATASLVRSVLGISPSAWDDAQKVMGEIPAAILIACILQRASTIKSAGGYLRSLTRKAEAGEFSLGPVLMALINTRRREKKIA